MIFKRAEVNGNIIAGSDIKNVYPPTPQTLNGTMIEATGNISVCAISGE